MAQIYTYSEVIVHFNPDCTDAFVTNANYKALEHDFSVMTEAAAAWALKVHHLTAELAECKKGWDQAVEALDSASEDAERYRWLRTFSKPGGGPAPALACQDGPYFNAPIYGEDLDRAIDNAVARSQA